MKGLKPMKTDSVVLRLSPCWEKYVELNITLGIAQDKALPMWGYGETRILLKPEQIDILIEQLKIAKESLIELQLQKDG